MKKYLYSAMILAAGLFASCSDTDLGGPKEDIGMTATAALAGEWYVHMDGIDANGEVTLDDPFGVGTFELLTYNTAANVADKMFVDDLENFWGMKGEVSCDVKNLTFSAKGAAELYNGITFDIEGKILPGAATSSYGHKVDSICIVVTFSDDDYIEAGYWNAIRLSGYRRTGFDQGND